MRRGLIVLLLTFGCSSSDGMATSPTDEESSGPTTKGPGSDPAVPFVPLDPRQVCERLLQCADQLAPSDYSDYFMQFGSTGSCWTQFSPQECEKACTDVLEVLGCEFCNSPSDCACEAYYYGCDPLKTACDPRRYTCVECASAADCPSSPAECLYQTGICNGLTSSCEFAYDSTFDVDVRASGLEAWELKRVRVRASNEPADCGPKENALLTVHDGAFETVLRGLVPQGLVVTVYIDENENSDPDEGEPMSVTDFGDKPGPYVLTLTASDFK